MHDWKHLPDLILEQIFSYLTWPERLSVACTCRSWNQTFYNPVLWKRFVYRPPAYLEKCSQRIYYDIATINLSNCFKTIGYCFQKVVIAPTSDFFILNRTLNVIGDFYRRQQKLSSFDDDFNPLTDYRTRLEYFSFEFASQLENGNLYGTGGALLESIKRLLDVLAGLRGASLRGVLLEEGERTGLLEAFIGHNRDSLEQFCAIDLGKSPLCEYALSGLRCLRRLEVGVCEMDGDLLVLLLQDTQLRELVLTQTRFTLFNAEFTSVNPISHHVWDLALELSPDLQVHQRYLFDTLPDFIDLSAVSIIYQPHPAPVTRFVFSSSSMALLDLSKLDFYHSSLRELIVVVDSGTCSGFRSSLDEYILQMAYNCPLLETLVLGGEQISVHSASLLHLLSEGCKGLNLLAIDERMVQYSIQDMSAEMFNSYASNDLIGLSTDPGLFVANVRSRLKLDNWNLMNSKQFHSFVKKYVT